MNPHLDDLKEHSQSRKHIKILEKKGRSSLLRKEHMEYKCMLTRQNWIYLQKVFNIFIVIIICCAGKATQMTEKIETKEFELQLALL